MTSPHHAVLGLLFTPDVILAFQEGVKIYCADNIYRIIILNLITCSLDYPERYVSWIPMILYHVLYF